MSTTVPSSTTAARRRRATSGCAGRRGGTARSASYGAAAGSGARRRANPGTLAIGGRGSPSLERRRALRKCGAAHSAPTRAPTRRATSNCSWTRSRCLSSPTVLSTASGSSVSCAYSPTTYGPPNLRSSGRCYLSRDCTAGRRSSTRAARREPCTTRAQSNYFTATSCHSRFTRSTPRQKKRALQVAQGARGGSPVGWRQAAWCPSPPASSSSSPCPRGRAAAAVAQGAGEGDHVEPGGRTWCQPAAQREWCADRGI